MVEYFGSHKAMIGMALGAALATFTVAPLLAAGGGGTGPILDCPKDQIRDADGKCKPATNNAIDHEARVAYALALAKAERYEEALVALNHASDQNDPRVLNYMGYSLRKSGRLDEGIGYYKRALATDPDYVLAREYLGEAYLTMGRLDLAEAELKEIETRCGTTCEAYLDLAEDIKDYRARNGQG